MSCFALFLPANILNMGEAQRFHERGPYHIALQRKSMDWFVYGKDLRYENVDTLSLCRIKK